MPAAEAERKNDYASWPARADAFRLYPELEPLQR